MSSFFSPTTSFVGLTVSDWNIFPDVMKHFNAGDGVMLERSQGGSFTIQSWNLAELGT